MNPALQEVQLQTAREIGFAAASAGLSVTELDKPEAWKEAVKKIQEEAKQLKIRHVFLSGHIQGFQQALDMVKENIKEILPRTQGVSGMGRIVLNDILTHLDTMGEKCE